MGIYTINDDPAADQTVQCVLDMVVEGILDLMGNYVQAIVVTGGYGRGEGGVYKNKDGYQLVNDLDLAVFVEKNYYHVKRKYNSLIEKLVSDLQPYAKGLKQIDIQITNTWVYRFAPNLVANYEIKNGYKTIYGTMNLSKIMPRLKAENLPLYDGTNYFRSRGSGMLLSAIYFLTNNLDNPKIRENFQIETQKACLAMGDAILLMAKQYHYSYQERLRRVKLLENNNNVIPRHLLEKVAKLYYWGSERKLRPSFEWAGNKTMIGKWFGVRNTFGEFFLWFESRRLNKGFRNWLDYSDYIHENGISEPWDVKLWNLLVKSKTLIGSLCKKYIKKDQIKLEKTDTTYLLTAMPLLLFSLHQNHDVDEKSFLHACNLLEVSSEKKDVSSWIDATKKYLSVWHPGGIVQEVIALKRKWWAISYYK
jgi:hypothetical protein